MGKPKTIVTSNLKTAKKETHFKAVRKAPIAKATRINRKKKASLTMKVEDLMPCKVIGLESLNDLAKKYRGKLNLQLKLTSKKEQTINVVLNYQIIKWEAEINKICFLDPVIAVENFVDNEGPPDDFHYVRENMTNDSAKVLLDPSFLVGCECFPRCSHAQCTCPINSHGKFAYDRRKCMLLPPGSPVYECNKNCKCSTECPNRVIQKGLTSRVCIFRTYDGRGWGLKTREFIPKNKFVVEYVGEIITSEEAERRGKFYDARQQTYLFDLDFYDQDATFTIDAYSYGNVSHFINHSCDPNLQVYSVWVDTLDPRLPRIGLFATRDIEAGEELSFDYMMTCNEKDVITPTKKRSKQNELKSPTNGNNIERVYCACGAKNCRKYLF